MGIMSLLLITEFAKMYRPSFNESTELSPTLFSEQFPLYRKILLKKRFLKLTGYFFCESRFLKDIPQ